MPSTCYLLAELLKGRRSTEVARLQMHKMATGAAGEGDPEISGLRRSHCAEGCLLSGCCDLWQTPPPL